MLHSHRWLQCRSWTDHFVGEENTKMIKYARYIVTKYGISLFIFYTIQRFLCLSRYVKHFPIMTSPRNKKPNFLLIKAILKKFWSSSKNRIYSKVQNSYNDIDRSHLFISFWTKTYFCRLHTHTHTHTHARTYTHICIYIYIYIYIYIMKWNKIFFKLKSAIF